MSSLQPPLSWPPSGLENRFQRDRLLHQHDVISWAGLGPHPCRGPLTKLPPKAGGSPGSRDNLNGMQQQAGSHMTRGKYPAWLSPKIV